MGAAVCYVEDNDSRHLSLLARSYDMEQSGNGWLFEGVQYGRQEPEIPVDFIIQDMGSAEMSRSDTDMIVLVCGTKPQELSHTVKLKRAQEGNHAFLLCPFVVEEAREDVSDALQDDYHKVLFLDFQPEPTDGTVNAKQFKMMITKYIRV